MRNGRSGGTRPAAIATIRGHRLASLYRVITVGQRHDPVNTPCPLSCSELMLTLIGRNQLRAIVGRAEGSCSSFGSSEGRGPRSFRQHGPPGGCRCAKGNARMLCTQIQQRRQEGDVTDISLLPCRSWNCEDCAKNRRSQLKAIAASGIPNICLTLTVNAGQGTDTVSRYKALHNAWKLLGKRILRQFSKEPGERWILTTEEGNKYQEIVTYTITKKTERHKVKRLHYMAFAEETKGGEPHLHILMRTKYIPQRWISEQMQELINSPVVWIEQIKSVKAAIHYVTKYVTKAPAQFGTSKRYWMSRFYQVNRPEKQELPLYSRIHTRMVRQSFRELITEIVVKGLIPIVLSRTQLRLLPVSKAADLYASGGQFEEHLDMASSAIWLRSWQRYFRI